MIKHNLYERKLPIKDKLIELLPGNDFLATHSLKGLRTRFYPLKGLRTRSYKDKELMIQKNNTFIDYLGNGILEKVDTTAYNKELIHYLPHIPWFANIRNHKSSCSF